MKKWHPESVRATWAIGKSPLPRHQNMCLFITSLPQDAVKSGALSELGASGHHTPSLLRPGGSSSELLQMAVIQLVMLVISTLNSH